MAPHPLFVNLPLLPATKKLTASQIHDLMLEFAARRVRVTAFCAERGIAVPTFRRWKREWDEKRRDERLAALPEKPLAWMPPINVEGHKEAPPSKDGVLTLMVDLADNLGPHTEQALQITVCCDGLVVSGKLIGALEYFAQMQEVMLRGASELLPKYMDEAKAALEKLLPDTERLPERREDWDVDYQPDEWRSPPEFIHLADVTIQSAGSTIQTRFWRGKLSAITSFWTESDYLG